MVGAINHGGGVDSGGADTECGRVLRNGLSSDDGAQLHGLHPLGFDPSRCRLERYDSISRRIVDERGFVIGLVLQLSNGRWFVEIDGVRQGKWATETATCYPSHSAHFKLLYRTWRRVGRVSDSVAKALQNADLHDGDEGNHYRLFDLLDFSGEHKSVMITQQLAFAAITAVLGTFDLEALKTLVGEIDDVLGGGK
jgi:hypothetical protein